MKSRYGTRLFPVHHKSLLWATAVVLLGACSEDSNIMDSQDRDGDGYTVEEGDCDDENASIAPDAEEICDEVDNDCDGTVDNTDSGASWYLDSDGDTFGDIENVLIACFQPVNRVLDSSDCDDSDAEIGAAVLWYQDLDGDGFGDSSISITACSLPQGYASIGGDCDEANAEINPNPLLEERCNGYDDNCDAVIDTDAVDQSDWYADVDGDGFGDPEISTTACVPPEGFVASNTDCDDDDLNSYPGAQESCNGSDNNCDTVVDNNPIDPLTWYLDLDEDGFGNGDSNAGGYIFVGCELPPDHPPNKFSFVDGDCKDTNSNVHPDAEEVCDGIDNNCDEITDPDIQTWYADIDGDGFGGLTGYPYCEQPAENWITVSGDCDTSNPEIHPNAIEVCDDVDNNCDQIIDPESTPNHRVWYLDGDGDGYGDSPTEVVSCGRVEGMTDLGNDCDDAQASVFPNAPELCDQQLNDCNALNDWTLENENGAVSFMANGTQNWIDYSAEYGQGTEDNPGYVYMYQSGTLAICEGTYYATTFVDTSQTLVMRGMGSERTSVRLSGANRTKVVDLQQGALHLENLTIEDGYSEEGGGIYTQTPSGVLRLDNVVVRNNAAIYRGGGIAARNGLIIEDSLIHGNVAEDGGGLYVFGGSTELTNVEVFENQSSDEGGGLYITALSETLVEITESHIHDNTGNTGAGFVLLGPGYKEFHNNTVSLNQASNEGGGGLIAEGTLNMSSTIFSQNSAEIRGGALYQLLTGTATLKNVEFTGNDASTGAAFFSIDGRSDVELDDCQFTNNVSAPSGAAIEVINATSIRSDFSGNIPKDLQGGPSTSLGDDAIFFCSSHGCFF